MIMKTMKMRLPMVDKDDDNDDCTGDDDDDDSLSPMKIHILDLGER